MLTLSRGIRESVVVGDPDGVGALRKVTVLEIDCGNVRLGFEADDDFYVHRWEASERIRAGDRRDAG